MVLSRHVMNAERVAEMQERAEFQAVKWQSCVKNDGVLHCCSWVMYEQHFLASIALYRLHQGAARPRPRIDLQPSSFMMEALPRSTEQSLTALEMLSKKGSLMSNVS